MGLPRLVLSYITFFLSIKCFGEEEKNIGLTLENQRISRNQLRLHSSLIWHVNYIWHIYVFKGLFDFFLVLGQNIHLNVGPLNYIYGQI